MYTVRPRNPVRKFLRVAAAVATLLWMAGMVGTFIWGVVTTPAAADAGGGFVMVGNDIMSKDIYNGGQFLAVLFMSACFPTVPYVLALFAIGVMYFAAGDS